MKCSPSLTIRVGESDRTEVLPPDTSEETIVYQNSSEPLALATGDRRTRPEASANGSRRTKSRVVLASLLLFGVLGAAWAIVIGLTKPPLEEIVQSPIAPVSPGKESGTNGSVLPAKQLPLLSEDFEWSEPVNLGAGVNTEQWNDHPTVTADGLTLVFVKHPDGQSSQLCQSTREDVAQPFGASVRLFEDANSYSDYCPLLSHDGLTLWFHSTRPIAPNRVDQNLWVTRRRSRAEPFEKPQPLGPEINTTDIEGNAFVSADGLTLLFTRGKPEQFFQANRRSASDDFTHAHALDAGFAGIWNGFPRLSADGRVLIFGAHLGEQRIWLATRDSVDAKFGAPSQLDETVNVGEVSGPFLSADEKTLYFSSTRPGGFGRRDLWSSTRVKKGTRAAEPPNSVASPSQDNLAIRVSPGVHVEMPSLKLDPASPHTIEAWGTPASRVQNDKHVFGWPQSSGLFVRNEDSSWAFGLTHTDKFQFVHDPQSLTPGRRVHVALVRTGKELRLFVDGQRVARQPEAATPLKDQSKPFSLSVAGTAAFSGDYDEVRVSRVARYDDNFAPQTRLEPDADTLALYHCDENGGSQLVDSSGNKHHGQIIGKGTWLGVGKAAANADAPPPAVAPFDATRAKAHQKAWADHLGVPVEYTNSIGMELRKSWSDSLAFGPSPAVRAGCVLHDHHQNRRLDVPAATGGVGHLSRNRTQMRQQIREVYFDSATSFPT